jgi:hypothetical protein
MTPHSVSSLNPYGHLLGYSNLEILPANPQSPGANFEIEEIHRTGWRPTDEAAIAIEGTSMAGTPELRLFRMPIDGTPEMRADRGKHREAV